MRLITATLVFFSLLIIPKTILSLEFFNKQNNNSNFKNKILPSQKAFLFNWYKKDNSIFLIWEIKEGYYLFQPTIIINKKNIFSELTKNQNNEYESFSKNHTYTRQLLIEIPLKNSYQGQVLTIEYKGCAKSGFCYPITIHTISINEFNHNYYDLDKNLSVNEVAKGNIIKSLREEKFESINHYTQINSIFNFFKIAMLSISLGITLAFTPCMLPMYPIISSMILGEERKQSKALILSFIYVQGMAITYSVLGLFISFIGLQIQSMIQHPYILICFCILFSILAVSMFGVYNLYIPNKMQIQLSIFNNKQRNANYFGIFFMGATAGLIGSPCTTAPVSGILLYVAQNGNLIIGGSILYLLGIGMGIPLMLTSIFGSKVLPKTGFWTHAIKKICGFILLAQAIFLLERILSEKYTAILWMFFILGILVWLCYIEKPIFYNRKLNILKVIVCLGLLIPIQTVIKYHYKNTITNQMETEFIQINNIEELEEQLLLAKKTEKPTIVSFHANWCITCKKIKKDTFSQFNVRSKLKKFILLQIDISKNTSQDIELLKYMNIIGLPSIEFWDAQGNYILNARLTGFIQAKQFLKHINDYNLINPNMV
ncbi:protein-disulfide reductase DsbD [Candidatus Photodesmus anomalopis]|uniref:Cytochrome C biogenesis protein transmembrane region n=1 Tax=Candidatus Photodesmus katoptron Akat1 TaxID=1236703 RepID=S3DID4_9GAMM|nr:protein-disulfide reductase DsbD [Candidatus Photodesmus katoptron]EPE37475.1 cytochrome C biogenesis protein transmembrane region [Candidatus Photodesmus katoptron Akat1]